MKSAALLIICSLLTLLILTAALGSLTPTPTVVAANGPAHLRLPQKCSEGHFCGLDAPDKGVWCTFDAIEADMEDYDDDRLELSVTVHGFTCDLP